MTQHRIAVIPGDGIGKEVMPEGAAVLTIWSMVYYMQKALPEIRARVK